MRAEKPEDKLRARRTNLMLFTISMVFCLAWTPLHLIGILLDQLNLFGDNIELAYLTYVACHLVCIKTQKYLKDSSVLRSVNFVMSFWYHQFSRTTNEKIRLYYYGTSSLIIFVRFLGELKTPERHFEIN